MRTISVWILVITTCTSCAQETTAKWTTKSWSFRLGDRNIHVDYAVSDSVQPYIVVQLHGNEQSSFEAAQRTLNSQGGSLLSIDNRERNITFRLKGKQYSFDPNRMFSRNGIQESLQTYGGYSAAAIDEVTAFAAFFLSRIPDSAVIIAVHNNSDNHFSSNSYVNDPAYRNIASKVHLNEDLDPDHFYLLTDRSLFHEISKWNYNVVLQNNQGAPDDGSLSIYCGRRNRRYINIEAQAGATEVQQTMLEKLIRHLKGNGE